MHINKSNLLPSKITCTIPNKINKLSACETTKHTTLAIDAVGHADLLHHSVHMVGHLLRGARVARKDALKQPHLHRGLFHGGRGGRGNSCLLHHLLLLPEVTVAYLSEGRGLGHLLLGQGAAPPSAGLVVVQRVATPPGGAATRGCPCSPGGRGGMNSRHK